MWCKKKNQFFGLESTKICSLTWYTRYAILIRNLYNNPDLLIWSFFKIYLFQVTTSNVKRLIVGHKRVILFKIDAKNRCYILPSRMSKEIAFSKFSFVNSPLSRELLLDVADNEGVEFCGKTPAFVLEKSSSPRH